MRLFKRWTRDQLLAALADIEASVAAGIASVSNPTQGGLSYTSIDNALKIIDQLNSRLDELDGVKPKNPIKRGVLYGVGSWRRTC